MKIKLAKKRPLASGTFRLTYAHPFDPTKVIKIPRADRAPTRERDPNQREFDEYQRRLASGTPLELYFPRLHGFVETDLGQGLCFDRVQGSDGRPPLSLLDWVETPDEGPPPQWVLAEYRKLAAFCVAHDLFASVDEPQNVGLIRDGAHLRLVAFDLKVRANREAIPISSLRFFRRRKIARRFARSISALEQRLQAVRVSDAANSERVAARHTAVDRGAAVGGRLRVGRLD